MVKVIFPNNKMQTAQQKYEEESARVNRNLGFFPVSLPTCYVDPWNINKRKMTRSDTKSRARPLYMYIPVIKSQDKALGDAEKLGLLRMKAKREAMKKKRAEAEAERRDCIRKLASIASGVPVSRIFVDGISAEDDVVGCSSESVVDAVERATVCMECGLDFIICTCQPVPPKAELTPPIPAEPAPIVEEEEPVEEATVDQGQVKIPYTGKPCPFTYKASFGGYICGCKDTYLNKEEQPACCMHWDYIKDGTWPGGCDSALDLPAGQGSCGKTPYKIFKVPDGSSGVTNRGRPYCEEHWKYILANEPFVCAYFEPRKPLERKNAFIEGDDTGHLDSVAPFAQSSGGTIVLPPPAPGPSRRLHAFCADCKRIYDIRIHACVNCGETTAVGRKEDIARAFGKSLSQMAWLAGSVKRFCEGCRVTKTMRRYDEEGKEEKLCYVCRQHPKPNKFAFIV